MLADDLTPDQLRHFGQHANARGYAYWREGRVMSCGVVGDEVRGIVRGSQAYTVRAVYSQGELSTLCSCPMRTQCKHVVALLLHYMAKAGATAKTKPLPPDVFATNSDAITFAQAHHIEYALAFAARMLLDALPPPRSGTYWWGHELGHRGLGDFASVDRIGRFCDTYELKILVAQAAHKALREEAATAQLGLAEEEILREEPTDVATIKLWRKLIDLRAALRTEATPRSRAARQLGTWTMDAASLTIEWREPFFVAHPNRYGTVPCIARLGFADGETPNVTCTCGAEDAKCVHVLDLVDTLLDDLADVAKSSASHELAQQLLRPAWQRALAALDALEQAPAKAPPIELWWELEPGARILLQPLVKRRTKRGTLSPGARIAVENVLAQHRNQIDDRDLRIANLLVAWAQQRGEIYPSQALEALVGHPRVVFQKSDQAIAVVRGRLGFSAVAHGDQIRIEPSLDGIRINPAHLASILDSHSASDFLVLAQPEYARCLIIDASREARRLWSVFHTHGNHFPPESHPQLLERIARIEQTVPISLPRELKGQLLRSDPVVVLRVRLLPNVSIEAEAFVRPGPGAPLFPPGSGPEDVMLVIDGERGYVHRQLDAELELVSRAIEQLPMITAVVGPPGCYSISAPDEALALVAALQEPPDGVEGEWIDNRVSVGRAAGVEGLRVKVEKRRDWFAITGDLKHDAGRIELALVLDAARRQQRFVRVDENRWIELTEQLSKQLQSLGDQTFASRDRLELSPGAVPALRALAEVGAAVDSDADWTRLTTTMLAAQNLKPKPPAALRAILRDYQIEGHAWLTRLAAWGVGACLADDMGLGKTIQAIAVLLDRGKQGPALVLAPTSVTLNWVDELKRFAPDLSPIVYGETADRSAMLAALGKKDVVIASYGLLVRDVELLSAIKFSTLVLDEAQVVKNQSTQRAKAARCLQAEFRIALSGTPFENHLGELWSLYAVVFPGLLGSWEQFRRRFATPIEKYKDNDASAALSRVLRPFMLRRTKQEVAQELPPRTEIDVAVVLSDKERDVYDDARLAAIAELNTKGGGVTEQQRRFQVLAALTRLRLLACHPKLADPTSKLPSAKLERTMELLEELRAEGHRALVFSQFTSHLGLVRTALVAAGFRLLYLDGSTPAAERRRLVQKFQGGEGDVFLISLKAGGQGINLTAADYVLHLDPWWNPAVEDQATDRAHRIGQDKPVTVYRLIARDTIEDQIRALHDDKRALIAGVLEGTDVAARLSTTDLLALLQAR